MQVGFSCPQFGRAFGDKLFKIAIDRIDLFDHQRHRSFRASSIAIKLVVGTADEHRKLIHVDRARGVGRLGDLLGDQTMHDYASASANEVTVMV